MLKMQKNSIAVKNTFKKYKIISLHVWVIVPSK